MAVSSLQSGEYGGGVPRHPQALCFRDDSSSGRFHGPALLAQPTANTGHSFFAEWIDQHNRDLSVCSWLGSWFEKVVVRSMQIHMQIHLARDSGSDACPGSYSQIVAELDQHVESDDVGVAHTSTAAICLRSSFSTILTCLRFEIGGARSSHSERDQRRLDNLWTSQGLSHLCL